LAFLISNSKKTFPLVAGGRGGKNRVLVYNHFFSFLENLDIDEFNKNFGHCAYGNDKHFLLLVI
jgi:hypothetical protein